MAFQTKTEPDSLSRVIPTTNKKEYCEMSISQLVSVLRIAFKIEDFDKIEQELVKREAKLRAEIGRLQEKIELERLQGIECEERLKIREEQCERGKRAQEDYEQLLKEVKTNGWIEKHAIEELRRKNVALEREVCELKEFKKIMLDDVNSVDELRDKIRVLKEEKVGDKNALDVLNMKNIEVKEEVKKNLTVIEGLRNENAKLTYEKVGNKNALDVLNMKNIELVEAVKKNLTVIEGLRNENAKLTDEKHELKTFIESLERRYSKLPVSYVKVEDSTHCSVDTGNAQSPKKGNKEDAVGALEQKKDQTEACKEGVKFKLEKEIVDLGDDDNDARYTSQGLRGEQTISRKIAENEHLQRVEMIKRQRASDIQASTSTFTSSADLFEKENLPVKEIMSREGPSRIDKGKVVKKPRRQARYIIKVPQMLPFPVATTLADVGSSRPTCPIIGPTPDPHVDSTPSIDHTSSIPMLSSVPSLDIHHPSDDLTDGVDPAPHDQLTIKPYGRGFLPSRVASQAITRSIKQQFLQPWPSWGAIPIEDREHFWQIFKQKVKWRAEHEAEIKKNFHSKASHRLSEMFRDARITGERPYWVEEHIWNSLLAHWNLPDYRNKCAIAQRNRASEKGGVLYTGGSITTHEHAIRMAVELGRAVHVDEVFKQTHLRKDTGAYVDERSRRTIEDFYVRLSQVRSKMGSTPADAASQVNADDDDIIRRQCWVDVVGGKRKGRLYGA
ncbi:uncharacterized protein LOC108320991 isoform X1 [Vigna angularis]|uniref:uncharacterized protein LOC108320991 isoform X1 n=1 Tax=Phaseolus angularis TaxID=3914 RepID=UPI0022B5459A|nr:uncharacterized protein LOC108320991 isoform X1 [Vigna angularis]XP_017408088.2 uncharacterized protein LOC108320991 isoform X1 [Vigna angularis]